MRMPLVNPVISKRNNLPSFICFSAKHVRVTAAAAAAAAAASCSLFWTWPDQEIPQTCFLAGGGSRSHRPRRSSALILQHIQVYLKLSNMMTERKNTNAALPVAKCEHTVLLHIQIMQCDLYVATNWLCAAEGKIDGRQSRRTDRDGWSEWVSSWMLNVECANIQADGGQGKKTEKMRQTSFPLQSLLTRKDDPPYKKRIYQMDTSCFRARFTSSVDTETFKVVLC